MHRWQVALLIAGFIVSPLSPARALDGDALLIGVGAFSVGESDRSAEIRLEYHPGLRIFQGNLWSGFDGLAPVIGFMANGDGGVFGYGGLQTDIALGDRWTATPAAGIGGYGRGDGRDLGGVLEFHLGLTLAFGIADGQRLGLTWAHISNATLHDVNPAANSLLLTYRARFDSLF